MSEDKELLGKTFDQQVQLAGEKIEGRNISPNLRIPGEVVFEPVLNGVRVTARDERHRMLWGFIASRDMIRQIHCPVAVYERLQRLLSDELRKHNLPADSEGDAMANAEQALSALRETVDSLRASMTVKKVSPATLERARAIARIASDVNRQIRLEASYFKRTKATTEQSDGGDN